LIVICKEIDDLADALVTPFRYDPKWFATKEGEDSAWATQPASGLMKAAHRQFKLRKKALCAARAGRAPPSV